MPVIEVAFTVGLRIADDTPYRKVESPGRRQQSDGTLEIVSRTLGAGQRVSGAWKALHWNPSGMCSCHLFLAR